MLNLFNLFKKKLLLSTFFALTSIIALSQTSLYENPRFDEIAETHKIIGIMPFKTTVTLRPKQMKKMSQGQLKSMEKSEGEGVQWAMYSWFMKRKKRGTLTVNVQNPSTTYAKLKKEGISYNNYDTYTPEELAKILEVDAVVMGTLKTSKPMSEGASAVLGLVIGFYGSTNMGVINLSIFNAKDGELLVNYNKAVSRSLGSSMDSVINAIMRKVSRRVAYTKNGK